MEPAIPDDALVAALCARLAERFGAGAPSTPELAAALATALADARAVWPDFALSASDFAAHVVARLPDDTAPLAALGAVRASELYLALACARGEAPALRAFEALYGAELTRAATRARAAEAADVVQLVRERLFAGAAPRIAEFAGQGSLAGWLRVTVTRLAVDLARKKSERPAADGAVQSLAVPAPDDPEVAYLRRLYGEEFRAAFELAVTDLTPAERNVLRWYHVQGLSIDQIAATRGGHRATAARQVQRAREALLQAVRARLAARLGVADAEVDSVMRAMGSDVHVSVRRVLASDLGEE